MKAVKTTFVRIVDPRLGRTDCRDRNWQLSDFVTVPRLSTYGTFNFGDFLDDNSIRNLLNAYAMIKNASTATNFRKPVVRQRKSQPSRERAMRA